MSDVFTVMDCAILTRTTGHAVQSLRELRDALLKVELDSIYYHFWGGLLRPTFDDPEYMNDFAVWVGRELRDRALAERLAMIDPSCHERICDLREELVECVEARLDELDRPLWVGRDRQFNLLAGRIVVIPTGLTIASPEVLPEAIEHFSHGSLFYHFVDARRRRSDSLDDLRAWLVGFDEGRYAPLEARLAMVDPFQGSLGRLGEVVREAIARGLEEVVA